MILNAHTMMILHKFTHNTVLSMIANSKYCVLFVYIGNISPYIILLPSSFVSNWQGCDHASGGHRQRPTHLPFFPLLLFPLFFPHSYIPPYRCQNSGFWWGLGPFVCLLFFADASTSISVQHCELGTRDRWVGVSLAVRAAPHTSHLLGIRFSLCESAATGR